jgi:hypothetical protein
MKRFIYGLVALLGILVLINMGISGIDRISASFVLSMGFLSILMFFLWSD